MKYYVLCPYGLVTGGPDALHQIVYYLNYIGKDAKLVYLNINDKQQEIPGPYKNYIKDYCLFSEIDDSNDTTIIIPEFVSFYSNTFKKSSVYIWWLSVYYNLNETSLMHKLYMIATYIPRLFVNRGIGFYRFNQMFKDNVKKTKYNFNNERNNVKHLCASYYAYDYVSKRTKNSCILLIEPISLKFLNNYSNNNLNRNDYVLYNPKKSGKFVELLKKRDNSIKFLPLNGYNQNELINLYQTSKLYVDFGPFPGAERMPKEAVINGCAIITGRNGAAKYYQDVCIDDKYKFDATKENIDIIIAKIKYVLNNYDQLKIEFNYYKNKVLSLEDTFIKELKKI